LFGLFQGLKTVLWKKFVWWGMAVSGTKSRGKRLSHESIFIRTGKIPAGISPKKAKALGARFLSYKWAQSASKKQKGQKMPLPTQNQRLYGGRLPKADLARINAQIDFALNAFNGHISPAKRASVKRQVRKYITGRMISINIALREQTRGKDLEKMREHGKELYHHLKKHGQIYPAIMQDTTGKTYFAKGWANDRYAATSPIHETVHILQKIGAIKVDVPFAQAADRLYALEQGILKPNPRIRNPKQGEFDRKPRLERVEGQAMFEEANWSYDTGTRIAQWLFKNFSGKS
jgi:hypothetical protein